MARETFPPGGQNKVRAYERHMQRALGAYAEALREAISLDKEGALTDTQAGGSSHGVTEALYRLAASRQKCLLRAVCHNDNTRAPAEMEALRLTEKFWYVQPNSEAAPNKGIRERIWLVLADVVGALSQCRLDEPFFHRSVYRYAQALMWAPILFDPREGSAQGSLATVPATRSHLIRGLNSSTGCAFSAEVVMASLFDKKRYVGSPF